MGCDRPLMSDARHNQVAGILSKPGGDVMAASVVSMDGDVVTLEVKVKLSGSMLESEESILAALKEAGCLARSCPATPFASTLLWWSEGCRFEPGQGELQRPSV